jgi:pimeloyl-ACP methyl ester carboxylesterase
MMKMLWILLLAALIAPGAFAADSTDPSPNPLAQAQSHFALLGTNKIHYVTLGQGAQAIVFVHCWSGRLDFWRFQVPALVDKARLLLLDLPGHGQSDKPHMPYTMDFFARAVDAVMRDAHVERAALIGHSMGTPVICRFYRDHPDKVKALIAVDGALRAFDMKPDQREGFIGPFREPDYRQHVTKFIADMFPNAGTEALRDRVLADILQTPQHVMVGAMEEMWRDQTAWVPEKIDVPLLVANARGRFWTPDYEAHVRSLGPKVDYRTMEGVGHFLMLEKPAEFNAILVDFLQKNGLTANAPDYLSEAGKQTGWRLLFDGKTTHGWRGYKQTAMPAKGWKVEDGILKKVGGESGGDIITEEKFDNFDLSWEWRVSPGGNNGLKYLVTEDRPSAPGHEYQMVDDAKNPDAKVGPHRATASFYDVLPPWEDRPLKPAGEWNLSRVVIQGDHVEHWLNGNKVLEYELGSAAIKAAIAKSKFRNSPGFGEKIKGHIMLTDHHDECWFRNIKLRELTAQ